MGLGAGASSEDLRYIYGPSVRLSGAQTVVDIGGPRPRTVPVLSSVAETLVGLAEKAGDRLVIGGAPSTGNLIYNLMRSVTGGEDLPNLEAARLRHSWMVGLMSAPIPVGILAELAGTSTLRTFEDLLDYVPAYDGHLDAVVASALELPWL